MAERIRCMKIGLLTMIDRGAPTRAQIGRQDWWGLKWTMPVRPSSDAEAEIVGLGIVRTWVYSIVVRAGTPTSCTCDRKSGVEGQSVLVRGDQGGRRKFKK